MELNRMINPNSHKTSFDIRLPHDPQSRCNKFITKGYSLCVCLLNISIKVIISFTISIGIIFVILSQLEPNIIWEELKQFIMNPNNSTYSTNDKALLSEDSS